MLTLTPAWMDSIVCAVLVGSACGVTKTVIVFGLGGVPGAVYVAVSEVTEPPEACEVTTVRVPHVVCVQPGPVTNHRRLVSGFEPAAAVKVATIDAVPPAVTTCGPLTCNAKLLLMVIEAVVCLEGSATLCAVKIAFAGEGRICGAV